MESSNSLTQNSEDTNLNIIIFGAPGSGKGTQSEKLIEKYNLYHISTGDMIRKEIANGTELGLLAKDIIGNGQLIPDELVINMIAEKMANKLPGKNGFIFDGFPRTPEQAQALNDLCEANGMKINILINLIVEEEQLIDRLLGRAKVSNRSDDNYETIIRRLHVYSNQTKPVCSFYDDSGICRRINGEGSVDEVFNRITEEIATVL